MALDSRSSQLTILAVIFVIFVTTLAFNSFGVMTGGSDDSVHNELSGKLDALVDAVDKLAGEFGKKKGAHVRRPQYKCSPREADLQAASYRNAHTIKKEFSACPSAAYLEDIQAISPDRDKIFIDIGANKGYETSTFLGLWAPELGWNPEFIGEHNM